MVLRNVKWENKRYMHLPLHCMSRRRGGPPFWSAEFIVTEVWRRNGPHQRVNQDPGFPTQINEEPKIRAPREKTPCLSFALLIPVHSTQQTFVSGEVQSEAAQATPMGELAQKIIQIRTYAVGFDRKI